MGRKTTRRPFGTIYQRAPRPGWYVKFNWHGQRLKRSAGTTKAEASKKLAAAEALLKAGTDLGAVLAEVFGDVHGSRLTFRDAAAHYFAYAERRKRVSTLQADARRMRGILKASWTAKYLGLVKTQDLLLWVGEREKEGAGGATINRDLGLVSALYRWAIRSAYVEDNPVSRVERFKERRGREVYLSAPECAALLRACAAPLRPLVQAAFTTGMRRGELLALRWRAIDLSRAEILVEAQTEKAGRGRVIAMTDALRGDLRRLKAERPRSVREGSARVFTRADGTAYTETALRYQFARAVERCEGIPLEKRETLRFHDLRHSAASLMVAAGIPLFDVAKILGHSQLSVTMRYAHFAPEAGRSAAKRLGDAMRKACETEAGGAVRTA